VWLKISTYVIAVLASCIAFAQESEPLSYEKVFGGYTYYQGNRILNMNSMMSLMQSNPEAYKLLRKGKSQSDLATVMGFAGGFAFGWPVGTWIGGGEPNWTLAAIGAGIFLASVPIQINANKKILQSVRKYNDDLSTTSLELHFSPAAFGLVYKF
jgi:hypothetical protein